MAGWALAERAGRACWACRARAAGGHAWGARAWRTGRAGGMGAGALGGMGAGERGAGARGLAAAGAAAGGASVRGRSAWALGLALGSALGALGPFSIRFDSFFFSESPNEHRSL